MKQQLEEVHVESNKNSLQLQNLLLQNDESLKLKESYEAKTDQLNSQLADLQSSVSDYTVRLQIGSQMQEELSSNYQNSLLQVDRLKTELHSKDKLTEDLTSQLSVTIPQLEATKAAYEDCLLQVSSMSDRLDASEKSKKQAQLQISALTVQLEAFRLKNGNVNSIPSSPNYNYQQQVNNSIEGASTLLPLPSSATRSANDVADTKIASQIELLQNKLKEALSGGQDQPRERTHPFSPYDATQQQNISSSSSHEFAGVFKDPDYSREQNQTFSRSLVTMDGSELKRLITRCDSLEKQIKSMPASLKIAQAERRVLESKLSKLNTAAEIKFAEKETETDRVRQELQAFLAVQMAEKESLNKKIQAQAATIHQLTHHLNILQSQQGANETSRREEETVLEFMKSHPSYNLNVTRLDVFIY